MEHLDALNLRLSNERVRLQSAKTEREREMRRVWIAQIEKEIADEYRFLGRTPDALPELSIDELAADLGIDTE